jgi:hypothetical protein
MLSLLVAETFSFFCFSPVEELKIYGFYADFVQEYESDGDK